MNWCPIIPIENFPTFAAVRELFTVDSESKFLDGADSLLGIVLLLGPTVVGMSPEAIAAGLSLLGAKNELVKVGKALFKRLTKPAEENEVERRNRMSAAFCLIVYTAYFESLSKAPTELHGLLEFTPKENEKLLACLSRTEEGPLDPADPTAPFCAMPHPAETLDQLITRMAPIYQDLTKGLTRLIKARSDWDSFGEKKRHETLERLQALPKTAGDRLRAQYFDLAARYSEFAIWTNLREHAATQVQIEHLSKGGKDLLVALAENRGAIDLGLNRLRGLVQELPKAIDDYHANAVWKDLDRQYSAAIQQPIIKDPSTTQGPGAVLKYPLRSEIFVPQSFKVLQYSAGLHLEDSRTWSSVSTRKDLGEFLLAYLASDYSSTSPLVILGHPGSGKSLLSQMLAAQTMSNAYAPIRLELRSINADNEIEAQIEEQIRKDIARAVPFSTLIDGLGNRPAIIIFDGYDELLQATGQVFAGYLTKVQKFQERESQTLERNPVRSIVTSRITLIDKAVIPIGTTVLRLLEFDDDQRQKWISVWNSANAPYFSFTGVKKFTLPAAAKVAAIAEQPLLLLMLALYDSRANELNQARGLDQTVLYESLLRRFISRERTKDPAFEDSTTEVLKEEEISQDMERLGVTAIGMFNRQALHIRATQLNADLEYFKLTKKMPAGSGRPLSQGELVLGGFFFVHQSTAQQRGDAGEEKEADASFEFLHNTFGEFLTGHFLTTQVLRRTLNLYKLRIDPDLAVHRLQILNDRDGLPPEWYASLMYAPLFARPVIVQLLTEWFSHALLRTGRDRKDVLADLDDIIYREVRRVISGREFPSVMVSQETSVPAISLFGSLATYTLNLITLRVAIGDEQFIFDEGRLDSLEHGPKVWEKLVGLWKSWFTVDELSALTLVFASERSGDTIVLRRAVASSSRVLGRRAETFMNVASALGDNVGLAIGGALMSHSIGAHAPLLDKARVAAAAEHLGLDDEILLRELWNACRTRVRDSLRQELFKKCAASIDRNNDSELGRSIDIVRAFGAIGDVMQYRSLVLNLVFGMYSHRMRLRPLANAQSLEALLDLLSTVEIRQHGPVPDLLNEGLELSIDSVDGKADLPANVALTILKAHILHRRDLPNGFVEALGLRMRDQEYLSTLSVYIGANVLRLAGRVNNKELADLFQSLLEYFLQPSEILRMNTESAISILSSAQRPRLRSVLPKFCDDLIASLEKTGESEIHLRLQGFRYRYVEDGWAEHLELAISLIGIFSKFGRSESRIKLYRFALNRWFRDGRLRLSLAVIEFGRSVDDGELLFQYADRHGGVGVMHKQLLRRFTVRGQLGRDSLKDLSVKDLSTIGWFASKTGDTETMAKVVELVQGFESFGSA